MSTEEDKLRHSKRIQDTDTKIKKQVKILKQHRVTVDEPHKFAKKHALNCGNPNCAMCGNPRKVWKKKTIKELSFEYTEKWIDD